MDRKLTLVIGNKNYSSWSMRAGLAARLSGLSCTEVLIPLNVPGYKERLREHSPSGLVPVLKIGDTVVWDSLAIIETFADLAPDAGVWPADPVTRAVARAVAAEMHAGFYRLRRDMPMDLRAERPGENHTEGALADAGRIATVWDECRNRFGSGGPFLFGGWSAADIMYAPVVGRFRTYGVPVDASIRDYMDAVWAHPHVADWVQAASDEPYTIETV